MRMPRSSRRGRRRTPPFSAPRWCTAPSTTPSTRSPAATAPICPTPPADRSYSQDAAAATAAFRVVAALVPSQLGGPRSAYDASLAAIPAGPPRTAGSRSARPRPRRCSRRAPNDGRNGPFTFVFGTTPGAWRPSPPLFLSTPRRGSATCGRSWCRTPRCSARTGPTALTSRAYARDFKEVKSVGSLTSTTPDGGSDDGGDLLAGAAGRAVRRRDAVALGAVRVEHRGERAPVRDGQPRGGGRRDRLLERQVLLELLAADRRDPRGGTDGNRADAGRSGLEGAVRPGDRHRSGALDAGLPGPPVGSQLREQRDAGRDAGVLRHGQDRVRHRELAVPRPAAALRALLARAAGGHRRARLGRDPLPHRGHAGRGASARRSPAGSASTTSSRSIDRASGGARSPSGAAARPVGSSRAVHEGGEGPPAVARSA